LLGWTGRVGVARTPCPVLPPRHGILAGRGTRPRLAHRAHKSTVCTRCTHVTLSADARGTYHHVRYQAGWYAGVGSVRGPRAPTPRAEEATRRARHRAGSVFELRRTRGLVSAARGSGNRRMPRRSTAGFPPKRLASRRSQRCAWASGGVHSIRARRNRLFDVDVSLCRGGGRTSHREA